MLFDNMLVSSPRTLGVFPATRSRRTGRESLPHARGGVSIPIIPNRLLLESSPRTWGCFRYLCSARHELQVFPTHVGVFPKNLTAMLSGCCLPHARGGVSVKTAAPATQRDSSTRPWGLLPPSLPRQMAHGFNIVPVWRDHKGGVVPGVVVGP